MIGEPPLAGAVQDTDAEALPAVALTPVGAEGAVAVAVTVIVRGGVTASGLTPFVAVSVNVAAPAVVGVPACPDLEAAADQSES